MSKALVATFTSALVAAACAAKAPATPPAPATPTSASTPTPSAPPGPVAGAWYADSCERAGPSSCEFKDPIETPSALPRCAAVGAEAGRPCKTERERCELVPGQRDRLSPCTLPARHLTCLKKAPPRTC